MKKPSSIVRPIANWWSRRTLAQRFATLTALLIAGTAIIQGAVLVGVASRIVSELEAARVQQQLDEAADQLATRVDEFRRVPIILSGTPPIERIVALSTGGTPREGESLEDWRQRLGIIFRSIVQAKPSLIQARFIGLADGGREIVRVERTGDTIKIVDEADLQRKGDRPYFHDTTKLRAGEVYLSSIDANVENGAVVTPFQPMLRAATPIFTRSGAIFGVVVVNTTPESWLRPISAVSGISGKFIAANQNGDYVFRSDGGPLLGTLNGLDPGFRHDFPQFDAVFNGNAPKILNLRAEGHVFSARRVDYNPADRKDFVLLATDTDASTVFGGTWTLTLLGAALALAMSAIGVLAAYFVSRPLKGLMSAAKQIAEGKLDVSALAKKGGNVEIGELGEALRIMEEAVESRDASLRKSEAHLQAIIDNTIDGLITIDRRGIIVRYNRGCEEIFGYTVAEAIGQNVKLLMPDPDAAKHDSYLERYERTREARFIGKRREVTGRHKDGRPIEIEVAIAEIRVGDEVLFSGIVQDVTERKEVDRLKSEFVSTVTHELRTPMTSIMGSLGLLRGGALGPLSEKAERMINLAHDNGTRLVSLINDILDIDKIEAGQLEFRKQSLNLKSLIEQSVNLNAACARENGAAIVVEAVDDDIFIDADPDRFQQLMGNLLSNAAKFSPRGGKVTITAIMKGPVVRVDVADQGPGIPLEFQPRIFQKFAQADSSDTRQKGGTGLGLNIAKAIVERLGGRIGFETEIGAGTKFYFDLLGRREAVASPSASHPAPASDMSGVLQVIRETDGPQSALPRVLHVEDDADTCAVVAECISDIAQVTAVPTAEEAREILMENSFNLVILDMLLPGENGDSVLRYLLERSTPPPRVLVFSGYEMAVDKWPPVTLALVKSRTDIVALRRHVLELLHGESASPPLKRSA